ncbi:uncharacterized protein ARMOST_08816 [Armillaria ostoyae]|uniref:Uncharacterized protein n=1 Tax=Armillaria ostoyae TaxID=47428 RepID=A0A284R9S2_ARMOS|nr:uncharacterized protein ARMOST_08816 [Armillaria ostoyae]
MSSVSKINQLPDELLALIFDTGLRDLSSDAHQPLLALICSICRHWRDVAIGASELWTTIHVPLEVHLAVIQTFLERSKGRLIDLHITELDSVVLAHKVAEITAPHISRARTLTMSLAGPGTYSVLSEAYRSIFATNLSSLSIHLAGWSFHSHSPLFASTNSLRYLDTEGDFLRDVPSRASLTTLELIKYSPTHVELQNLFDASPCLETLVLHEFILVAPMRANEDNVPPTITAPATLKSLAVSVSYTHNNGTDICGCVLDRLCIPNLEYLEVVGTYELAIDLNIHFRGLSKVQTLRIRRCTITSADQLFLSLKELRRLELVDMSPELDIRHITGISTEDPSSPSLSHLSSVFFSTKRGNIEIPYKLLQLAEHCIAAGCPRFTLEIEQGCPEEFLNAIESCIQDGRVCVIESDCSDGLIKSKATGIHGHFFGDLDEEEFEEEEMDEWEPEWEIEDDGWDEVEDDEFEID